MDVTDRMIPQQYTANKLKVPGRNEIKLLFAIRHNIFHKEYQAHGT